MSAIFPTNKTPRFSCNFESGSIGKSKQLDNEGLAWELALCDDNHNPKLPATFRAWFYFKIDDVPLDEILTIKLTRFGWPFFFVPVFSYNGTDWHYFNENAVKLCEGADSTDPDRYCLQLSAKFIKPSVFIARTFPYTTQDLDHFLGTIRSKPHVFITEIGTTPIKRQQIPLIRLEDVSSKEPKKVVWIHGRTHAAETGSSYVLEGMIDAVLKDDKLGRELRRRFIFVIAPMHNKDGVIVGNYRTNATSINLETQWLPESEKQPLCLASNAPIENHLLNKEMARLLKAENKVTGENKVVLALNLHSSNEPPNSAAFFFPHFGVDPAKYTLQQISLWQQQIAFIDLVTLHYGGRISRPPQEGGAGFLQADYPETWWWRNRQDEVNAISLETVYGRAGFDHWVTRNDWRNLGIALARAIADMRTSGIKSRSLAASSPYMPAFSLQYINEEVDLDLYENEDDK